MAGDFNSRAHVERDLRMAQGIEDLRSFQLTRSRGARLTEIKVVDVHPHFNSRAHVERDDLDNRILHINHNFNSRAHVERD